jgi:hypothetical protein
LTRIFKRAAAVTARFAVLVEGSRIRDLGGTASRVRIRLAITAQINATE